MKWTDGGGLPVGTHTGPGQPVSGTHGSSSATAPLSSMISIFVDKEFENNEEDEEEEGNGEKGGGGGGVRGDLNSPHTKRPRTQILGGNHHKKQKNLAFLFSFSCPLLPFIFLFYYLCFFLLLLPSLSPQFLLFPSSLTPYSFLLLLLSSPLSPYSSPLSFSLFSHLPCSSYPHDPLPPFP